MNEKEQKRAAKEFAEYWKDKGDEKSDSHIDKFHKTWYYLKREICYVMNCNIGGDFRLLPVISGTDI